jgi:hypothetical protein
MAYDRSRDPQIEPPLHRCHCGEDAQGGQCTICDEEGCSNPRWHGPNIFYDRIGRRSKAASDLGRAVR